MREILLVRHCQTSGQEPDAPLTREGVRQADRLDAFLARFAIDGVVSSPYRRALQTAAPLAQRTGLVLQEDARLRERTLAEDAQPDWQQHLARSFDDPDYCLSTGESGRAAAERGWAAIEETLRSGLRLPVFVTHGNLLSLVLQAVDASIGFDFWRRLTNPDVFRMTRPAGGAWSLERVWTSSDD